MEVETLGMARSLGWKAKMNAEAGGDRSNRQSLTD
jgi:hypothetical protein